VISEHIEAPRRAPFAALAGALLAVAVVLIGLAFHVEVLWWVALLPAVVAVDCAVGRGPRFAGTFTATGVLLDGSTSEIPYAAIQAIERIPGGLPRSRKASLPLRAVQLYHAGGLIVLRAPLGRPLREIYDFLLERLGLSGSRELDPALAVHLRSQIETFGSERVYSFGSRYAGPGPRRPWSGGRRRALRIGLASAAVGVVWLIVAARESEDLRFALGIPLIAGGLLAMLLSRATFGVARKHMRTAALVISPLGLALRLGDVIGELKWKELRAVKCGPGRRDVWGTSRDIAAPLWLEVEGATVGISDCFDRPLDVIYRLVCHYWEGTPLSGPAPPVPPRP
jgi:hypothetical protein